MVARMTKQKLDPPLEIGQQRDGVWRRSADTYVVAIRIDGKRHQRSFGNDYEAALLYVERLKQEHRLKQLKGDNPLLDQIVHTASGISVKAVLENYRSSKAPFLKPGTLEFYTYLLNRLTPLWDMEAEKISVSDISGFVNSLKTAGLSNKIIRELISFCKSAFNLAIEHELIAAHRNAFAKVKAPIADRFEPQPFTQAEIKSIFDELNPRLRLMFWVQLCTGLRSGELIALRFGDIDFQRSRMNIRRTRRHGIENTPKTKTSLREVFMPPDVGESLQSLQDARKGHKDDYVFLTQYGLPYDDIPHEPWKQAVERAGVDYRRCYTLRHSFASQALSNNVRLSYVSAALGHSSVNVTAQKYIRHLPDANEADEKRLSRLSEKSGPKLSIVRGTPAVLDNGKLKKSKGLTK